MIIILNLLKLKIFIKNILVIILSIDQLMVEEQPVFKEKLSYEKADTYLDGVKLKVSDHYMVPV